ncbi:hypothetical protein RRG08_055082 [Elysia crispata]|uniref:Uncharacterized protein n=1 Tax=Elysia crispata TaxID=231223 RepID=A0AAE1E7F9_9GAST|nr:hypothetical protein RRG08_055082 [Elysia crispata]
MTYSWFSVYLLRPDLEVITSGPGFAVYRTRRECCKETRSSSSAPTWLYSGVRLTLTENANLSAGRHAKPIPSLSSVASSTLEHTMSCVYVGYLEVTRRENLSYNIEGNLAC